MSDFSEKYNNDFFKDYFFVEKISAQKLYAIINCDDAVLNVRKWWEDQNFTTQFGETISCEKQHLQNMLDSVTKNKKTGNLEITVQYFSRKNYGRIYPKNGMSLGMLRREIRHYLCDDLYYDVDMINAHPSIAVGLCEMWDIDCVDLESYVVNREKKLTQYMKHFGILRCDVKTMFCSMLNGGSWQSAIKNIKGMDYKIKKSKATKYLDDFKTDCMIVCKEFKKKIHPKMYNEITNHKTLKRAKNRTFISIFLQIYEEKILRLLYGLLEEYNLVKMGNSRCVLCHDGAMIEKTSFDGKHIDIYSFIEELNELVKEEMGFKCDFKLKEFDEKNKIKMILDKHIKKQKKENKEFVDPHAEYVDPWVAKYNIWKSDKVEPTDKALAHLYYDMNKTQFVVCNNKLYKKNKSGLFQHTTKEGMRKMYNSHLEDFIKFEENNCSKFHKFVQVLNEKFYVEDPGKKGDETKYMLLKECDEIRKELKLAGETLNKQKKILLSKLNNNTGIKHIVATLVPMYDDDDFSEKLDLEPNLLGFNNGIIDLESKNIFEVRNATGGEYVSMTCGYDFYVNEAVKKDSQAVYNLINEMFEDETVTNFVVLTIAKCLKGCNNTEEFASFWLGDGGNGKGLLTTFIHKAFGDYFYPLSYTVFTHINTNTDNRSVELYEARKKRYYAISEPAKKLPFNTDTFKAWTGKDAITCRNNNAKKMTQFIPSPSTFQANHYIEFEGDTSGESMIRRIKAIIFPYLFKTIQEFDKKNSKHKIQDSTWKAKCSEDRYKRAFMFLLLTYYKKYQENGLTIPEKVCEYSKEYTKHIAPDKDWFDNNLVKDNKNGHNIRVKLLLEEFREETKSSWQLKQFIQKLEEYGFELDNGRAYSLCGEYQVGGNSTKYVKNVKYMGLVCESDDEEE